MTNVKGMKLNKFGTVEIVRGKERDTMKLFCPHKKYEDAKSGKLEAAFCGHECALFSEPVFHEDQVTIQLCQNILVCDKANFSDERQERRER